MAAAIWSTDLTDVNEMPALFFVRFFKNHGLLSVTDRPQWYTLPGGSSTYIEPLTREFRDRIRLKTRVRAVKQTDKELLSPLSSGPSSTMRQFSLHTPISHWQCSMIGSQN